MFRGEYVLLGKAVMLYYKECKKENKKKMELCFVLFTPFYVETSTNSVAAVESSLIFHIWSRKRNNILIIYKYFSLTFHLSLD